MEDVELMRRIRKKNGNIIILLTPVVTSARRWDQEGFFIQHYEIASLSFCTGVGFLVEKLARFYPWQTESISKNS